ncbi:MAG: 2-C-methyl-D-erythritol 4-phosphate cytidylyltransferase [Cyanobacteria bacterium SIG27]|nr:2-C-methyl-D-erythritol 4-phosphate cytidylyltransferase [Cyanobacteria bacterium SIG27]
MKDLIILNKKTIAIITSGGSSTRFGSNKLLEKIGEMSVIETTISKFIDLVDEIIIPAKDDIKEHISNSKLFCNKIKFAPSGETRQKSVYNGLLECDNCDIVLIHDGARPFIDIETIKKTIELTKEKRAVVVGIKAIDTIKQIKDGKIIKTLDRAEIFHAQTPQAFEYNLIKNIHEKYKNNPNFTDDSSMAEAENIDVYYLEATIKNKKITTKDDLS